MKNKRFPNYPDDSDYTTNAPSYYDDLARKQKLIQLLAEKIWKYENTLNETLEQIEKRLTDYILENDQLMNERLENWDQRIEDIPEEMRSLFVSWLNDGTLEQIINNDVLGNKADQFELDQTNILLGQTAKVANVKSFGAKGDELTDDTQAIKDAIASIGNYGGVVYFPTGRYLVNGEIDLINLNIHNAHRLSLVGENSGSVFIIQTDPDADTTLNYDNGAGDWQEYGVERHKIELKNLRIQPGGVLGWTLNHPGLAINLNGANYATLKNIYIERFDRGIYSNQGWINYYENIHTNLCRQGLFINNQGYACQLIKPIFTRCGVKTDGSYDFTNGFGLKIKRSGGIDVIGILLELNNAKGVWLDNVSAANFIGGNVESAPNERSFFIQSSDYNNENFDNDRYTRGIKFSGIRFWNANGFSIRRGVRHVTIENCNWRFSQGFPINDQSCVAIEPNAVDFYKHVSDIQLNNNSYWEGSKPTHHTNVIKLAGYPILAFTMNGRKETDLILTALNDRFNFDDVDIVEGTMIHVTDIGNTGFIVYIYYKWGDVNSFKGIPHAITQYTPPEP